MKWLCCTIEFGDSQAVVASFQATKWRSTMRGRNIPEAAAGGGVPAAPGTKQEEHQHQESTESGIIDDDDDDDFASCLG